MQFHKSDYYLMDESKIIKEDEHAEPGNHISKDSGQLIADSVEEVKRSEEVNEQKNETEQPDNLATPEIRDEVTKIDEKQLNKEKRSQYKIARLVVSVIGFVTGALAIILAIQFGYIDN